MNNQPKYKVVLTPVPPNEPEPLPGEIWELADGKIGYIISPNDGYRYRYVDMFTNTINMTNGRLTFTRKIGTLKVENI